MSLVGRYTVVERSIDCISCGVPVGSTCFTATKATSPHKDRINRFRKLIAQDGSPISPEQFDAKRMIDDAIIIELRNFFALHQAE